MKPREPRNRWLTVGDVAALAGVSVDTVRGWDRNGLLPAQRTVGGQRRYLLVNVEEFLRRKMALPPDPEPSRPQVAHGSGGRGAPPRGSGTLIRAPRAELNSPWQEEVADAEAEVEFLKARREAQAVRRATAEEAQQAARRAEQARLQQETEKRLQEIKTYGRTLAGSLPSGWQAEVVKDLESFVTPQQFPASLNDREVWAYVEARVQRVKDRYSEAERQRREQERRQSQVASLVRCGEMIALTETMEWEYEEAQSARRAVRRELDAQVRWDWTDAEVRELVMEVLDQWKDGDEDEGDDDGEGDDGEDGVGGNEDNEDDDYGFEDEVEGADEGEDQDADDMT